MSFSFKRPVFSAGPAATSTQRQEPAQEEDWGDSDDDDEIMETFVLAATQVEQFAEVAETPKPKTGEQLGNGRRVVEPTNHWLNGLSAIPESPKKNQDGGYTLQLEEKEGEAAILREQVQERNLRLAELKEEMTKQAVAQKRNYEQMLMAKSSELNQIKTQLNFKEIDVQNLEQRCKKLESNQLQVQSPHAQNRKNKRISDFDYLERDAFGTTRRSKAPMANSAAQTDIFPRARRPKVNILSSLAPVASDTTTTDRLLRRTLSSLLSSLQSDRVEHDFEPVTNALKGLVLSDLTDQTFEVFGSLCDAVRESSQNSEKCGDFLSSVIDPFLAQSLKSVETPNSALLRAVSGLCLTADFRFEQRLPNLIVISCGLVALRHERSGCELLKVLLAKKKDSLYKTLLSAYTEGLQFIPLLDATGCGCVEEFLKQLYYSIDDNFTGYRKYLERNVDFKPANLLNAENVLLYSDRPDELRATASEWQVRTRELVPIFQRILLKSELVNSGNTRMWIISGLQSLKLFRLILNASVADVDVFLDYLSIPDTPVSVLQNTLLERSLADLETRDIYVI